MQIGQTLPTTWGHELFEKDGVFSWNMFTPRNLRCDQSALAQNGVLATQGRGVVKVLAAGDVVSRRKYDPC